ncbi:regulator of microtubule dynamics protein 1 isoform X1 [Lingula anatina]|uniref:Regulator of microtubule dynamics protein 1 isoform X1 n=1 Tax=Lingula anatina TaxID=7574 RepID=A0A1S3JQW3_LINAN|nr:regulator of microtubule dynamics protein 1 isoform X1 [Lingula anatina]|eukprot:XP_013412747.1 regulator of microtubule dynamics protein 1 isoform X1 [Lingula anatina]
MSVLLGENSSVILSISGITIGATTLILYYRLTRNVNSELNQLTCSVNNLRDEIKRLQEKIDGATASVGATGRSTTGGSILRAKQRIPGYVSATSSGDEDDVYEEALEGDEEYETSREYDSGSLSSQSLKGKPLKTSTQKLFETVDKLLEGSDQEKENAYNLLAAKKDILTYSQNPDFLWRLSKAAYFLSQIENGRGNDERKKSLVYEARDSAQDAFSIDENKAEAHKWYAITLGSIGEIEGMQVKIKSGYEFKDHIEKAIAINPSDPSLHHLLGRWCYGVYMLTWIERKVASTLFATPPTATIDEALKHFKEAERLSPGKWKENMLYLAKSFIEKKDYSSAVLWLEKADALVGSSQDDKTAQEEITKLLNQYRTYA